MRGKKEGPSISEMLGLTKKDRDAAGVVLNDLTQAFKDAIAQRPNSNPLAVLQSSAIRRKAMENLIAAGHAPSTAQSLVDNLIIETVPIPRPVKLQSPASSGFDVTPGRQQSSHGGPFVPLVERRTRGGEPERRVQENTPQARIPHF